MQKSEDSKANDVFEIQATDCREVNLLFLGLVRNAAIHSPEAAMTQYGGTKEFVDQLRSASIDDLKAMSDSVVPLFRLKIKEDAILGNLSDRAKSALNHLADR